MSKPIEATEKYIKLKVQFYSRFHTSSLHPHLTKRFQVQDSNSHSVIKRWTLCILNHCHKVLSLFNRDSVPIIFVQTMGHLFKAFSGQFTKIAK